jgi:hypothetical protein
VAAEKSMPKTKAARRHDVEVALAALRTPSAAGLRWLCDASEDEDDE